MTTICMLFLPHSLPLCLSLSLTHSLFFSLSLLNSTPPPCFQNTFGLLFRSAGRKWTRASIVVLMPLVLYEVNPWNHPRWQVLLLFTEQKLKLFCVSWWLASGLPATWDPSSSSCGHSGGPWLQGKDLAWRRLWCGHSPCALKVTLPLSPLALPRLRLYLWTALLSLHWVQPVWGPWGASGGIFVPPCSAGPGSVWLTVP
jgi:hypothetical protein